TDPPTAAPVNPLAKYYAECGDCRNCQFFTPYYSLCYANWGPRDCGLMPKSTHRWCGSLPAFVPVPPKAAPTRRPTTSTRRPATRPPQPTPSTAAPGVFLGPKASEVRVPVGVFVSLSETSPGKCIRSNDGLLQVVPCSFDDSTKFSIRPFETEEVTIKIAGTDWKITESFGRVVATTVSKVDSVHPDTQTWFYDPLAKTIRSKTNSQACLTLVEDKIHGAVQGRLCDADNEFQQWSYNDLTGQIYYMEKMGLCLATDGPNQPLHVQFCDITVQNQKWVFELAHHGKKKQAPLPCEYNNQPAPATLAPPVQAPATAVAPTTTTTLAPTTTAAPATTAAPTTTTTAAPATTTAAPTKTRTRRPLPSPCDKNEMDANTTVAPTTTQRETIGYSGACKKDAFPTIFNTQNKRCSSLLTVGEEVSVCCGDVSAAPTTTTAAPTTTATAPTTTATAPTTTAAPTTAAPTTAAPTTAATTTTAAPAPVTPLVPDHQETEAKDGIPNEPVAYINYFIHQHACVGFGATWCEACEWTKETVADVGGKLTFLELDTKVAGGGPAGDAISAALTSITGSNSYPSIWIGGKYIGSSDKIADLDAAGKLTDLLQAAGCL
ncbi:hypothetical protein DYB35_011545, partial [Aphanomyces astaci]